MKCPTERALVSGRVQSVSNRIRGKRRSWIVNKSRFPASSTIPAEFAEVVRRTPNAIALELGCAEAPAAATLSYKELSDRARDLALGLVAFGVKPGDHAGFATARNFDVVVAMLGILWAGVAYIPLDLSYPSRPLGKM